MKLLRLPFFPVSRCELAARFLRQLALLMSLKHRITGSAPRYYVNYSRHLEFQDHEQVQDKINVKYGITLAELVRSAHLFVKISSHCKFASKNTKFTAAILDFTVENTLKVEINVRNKNPVSELVKKKVHLFVKK